MFRCFGRLHFAAFFLLLAVVSLSGASVAQVQNVSCNSRVVETKLQDLLSQKYGPPAIAQIQAIASGFEGNIAQVEITDVQMLQQIPNGFTCSASATVRRQDTGQVTQVSAQFTIISQFDSTSIRIALSNVCVGFRLNSGASWVFRSGRRASDGTSQISTAA